MSRFGFAGSIVLFLSAFLSLVFATALMAPAVVYQLAAFDARLLARDWLGTMQQQFDLPGEPIEFRMSWTDQVAGALLEQNTSRPSEINIFRPVEFQSLQHFGQISGYTVFTKFGELFIAGGTPSQRSFDNLAFADALQRAMQLGETVVVTHQQLGENAAPKLFVIIPLFKFNAPRGAVSIEVERTHIEGVMERGVQFASLVTASILALLASTVMITLFFWGRKTRRAEKEAVKLAFFDPLTGLPNRRRFHVELPQAIETACQNDQSFGLMSVDVDCFKQINDLYGHSAGDKVLDEIGRRLSAHLGPKDKVYRLSGDEFVAILQLAEDHACLSRVASEIIWSTSTPIEVDESHIMATISLGAATYPEHGEDPETLLRASDVALYDAKENGRNTYSLYTTELDREVRLRNQLEQDLRYALEHNELELAYQPQVNAESGQLLGFEALARWHHKERGHINPQEFVAVAEQSGLIHALGNWALETACREAARWPAHLTIAVNLSPLQLRDAQVVSCVRRALDLTGLAPERLELEITEGVFVFDTAQVRETLDELRKMGVGIAMDDFGTGYSSLSYLTRMPLTKLKIDRSFVTNFTQGKADDAIVNCVVGLSKSLRLSVVAEGVETESQVAALSGAGCDILQGYYFGRPTKSPLEVIEQLSRGVKLRA